MSLRNTGTGPCRPPRFCGVLSPDGRYLVIGGVDPSKPEAPFLLPVAGGEPRRLVLETERLQGPLDWAADSSAIYALKPPAELWRLAIDGGEPRKVNLKVKGSRLNRMGLLRMHPDGRSVAFPARLAAKPAEVWVLENFLPSLTASK